jgi:FOG: Ankyrin repeat
MSEFIAACDGGDLAKVERLLKAGADPNAVDCGWPAICGAINSGGNEAVGFALLAAGADPNATETQTGCSALVLAADKGFPDLARALLEANADPNAQASDGATALFTAAQSGFTDVARALVEDGRTEVDLANRGGLTPLWSAADGGHLSVVNMLLKANANIDPT